MEADSPWRVSSLQASFRGSQYLPWPRQAGSIRAGVIFAAPCGPEATPDRRPCPRKRRWSALWLPPGRGDPCGRMPPSPWAQGPLKPYVLAIRDVLNRTGDALAKLGASCAASPRGGDVPLLGQSPGWGRPAAGPLLHPPACSMPACLPACSMPARLPACSMPACLPARCLPACPPARLPACLPACPPARPPARLPLIRTRPPTDRAPPPSLCGPATQGTLTRARSCLLPWTTLPPPARRPRQRHSCQTSPAPSRRGLTTASPSPPAPPWQLPRAHQEAA